MTRLVVDSSVAIKWFVNEPDSEATVFVRERNALMAPELLIAECVNVFWKKARRGEITPEDAVLACRGLGLADIALKQMADLATEAGTMAVAFDHPAYDCFYLALSAAEGLPYVTSDLSFVRKLRAANFRDAEVLTLAEADALPL